MAFGYCTICKNTYDSINTLVVHDCEPPQPKVCTNCHLTPCECEDK